MSNTNENTYGSKTEDKSDDYALLWVIFWLLWAPFSVVRFLTDILGVWNFLQWILPFL